MSDDLRAKLRAKAKRKMLAAGLTPDPPVSAPKRRARKKVYKKGAKPKSYDDATLRPEPAPPSPPPVEEPEDDGVESPPRRQRATRDTSGGPVTYEPQAKADKRRAEKARGFYACLACRWISYVGLGWRKTPKCLRCGGRTVETTRGHCEDNHRRIVM